MSSPPAKRKNMATTADGARYNKRQRPDNYAAMLAMPPPPRPTPAASKPTTKVLPPHARRADWSRWTKPQTAAAKDIATMTDVTQLDEAAQDTPMARDFAPHEIEELKPASEDSKSDAEDDDADIDALFNDDSDNDSANDNVSNAEDTNITNADAKNSDTESGIAEISNTPTTAPISANVTQVTVGAATDSNMLNDHDRATSERPNEEPGSPVDAPDTHFGDYTPMGQGQKKTIYNLTARKGGFKDDDRDTGNWKEQSRRNIIFGQHNAFPGLDDAIHGKKGDVEALLYLKQVRNEAAGLPTTVRGPESNDPRGLYNTGLGDTRGYYSDGAYVAAPIMAPAPIIGPVIPPGWMSNVEDELAHDEAFNDFVDDEGPVKWLDPQESYQNRLLLRFEGFCNLLAESPPKAARDSLGRSKVHYFPTKPKAMGKAVREWLKIFSEEPPHPVQIALMDGHCVLNLLDIIKRKLEAFKDVEENTSLWIFALLARLTHVRPIHCDETSSIARELALRALMVRVTFSGEHISELSPKVPLYDNEDKQFFKDVGVDLKQSDKQQMKKESNKTQESVGLKESEALDTEGLKKMLAEKKELLARQEALHKRVDEMPKLLSKREAFGLSPREESDGEGDDDEKRENPYDVGTPCANTRTTIDMILSLACDIFGQKDLAKYKEIWGEYDYPKPSIEMELVFGEDGVSSRPSSSQELRPMLSPLSSPLRASFSPEQKN